MRPLLQRQKQTKILRKMGGVFIASYLRQNKPTSEAINPDSKAKGTTNQIGGLYIPLIQRSVRKRITMQDSDFIIIF